MSTQRSHKSNWTEMEKLAVHHQERKGREKCDSKTWSCSEPSGSTASYSDLQDADAPKAPGSGGLGVR